jgi:hypothetical protein
MAIRVSVLIFVWLLVTGGVARAQEVEPEPPSREEIARGVVRNVRRMIAIGPTLGTFGAYAPSPGEIDAGLSFGLEAALFKTSLPTPARIREIAKQKTKEKLARIIAERFAGQQPDRATLEQLVREIAAEVKAEVIAAISKKPPVLERPRLAIALEANYLFGPADWLSRFGFGVGIGPVAIGPTFSVRFGDDTVARLGGDLTVRLLPMSSPRSPVLDLFLRADFELHARDTNDDQIALGVRLLLDII